MSLRPAEALAAHLVWTHLTTHGEWPERHEILLAVDDQGLSLNDAWRIVRRGIRHGSNLTTTVAELSIDGMVQIPEARQLLEPLGQASARLAHEFLRAGPSASGTGPRVPWMIFRDLWPDESQWKTITFLFTNGALETPFNNPIRTETETQVATSIECLRFINTKSLSEKLEILLRRHHRNDIGQFPAGAHLAFLKRAFEFVLENRRWPNAAAFAVSERELGFVPDLHRDLRQAGFLRWDFREPDGAIELETKVLPFIDPSGVGRKTLLAVVEQCRQHWRREPTTPIGSRELAVAIGVEEPVLKAWLLLLHPSDWGTLDNTENEWKLSMAEAVLRYRNLAKWDDYLDLQNPTPTEYELGANEPETQQAPLFSNLPSIARRIRKLVKQPNLAFELELRLDETQKVYESGAVRSAMIVLGSILEGIILDVLQRNPAKAAGGKNDKPLEKIGLGELLERASRLNLLAMATTNLLYEVKEFRDFVHPNKAANSNWKPTSEALRACAIAIERASSDLEQALTDGRITAFES